MAVRRTAAEYAAQLLALLPPGPAWEGEAGAAVALVLAALAQEFARVDQRGYDALQESDPWSVRELVPDWERVMSLPDPCLGTSPAFEDRQASVRQRLVAVGAQTPAYFVGLAQQQGYPNARVIERRAPRFGHRRGFGAARWGNWDAQFVWVLQTGGRLQAGRRWGATNWGERYGANPASGLECLIHRYAPAHTVPQIDYSE